MTKEQFEDVMIHLNGKQEMYNDLVWYARIKLENIDVAGVKENKERIKESYPEEIKNLMGEFGSWEHGFNSGVLAGLRYASTLLEFGIEDAEGEFPDMDS